MNPERWQEVKDLFERALARPVSERREFLEKESRGDAALYTEALRLVNAEASPPGFLTPPTLDELPATVRQVRADLTGTRLGPYLIQRELGRGGMGVVYLARDDDGLEVALKILPPHLLRTGEMVERFRRESLAAARLEHPGIVRILSFGEEGGAYYYAMEYVRGASLAEPQEGLAEPAAVAALVERIARALHAAHLAGVVHRDVKPANILIDEEGAPRVVDFGLARLEDLDSLTRSGDVAGTPHYMSPEQARAVAAPIDHRTDVYSLGAVLYEQLTGARPFDGPSAPELLYRIAHTIPRAVRSRAPHVSSQLALVCHKALRRRPGDRYSDMGAFADDLAAVVAGRAVAARGPGPATRVRDRLAAPQARRWASAAALAVALVGGGMGTKLVVDARASAKRPMVVVAAKGDTTVSVHALRYPNIPGSEFQHELLGSATGSSLERRFEPGRARFIIVDGERFAELERDVQAPRVHLDAPLKSVAEVRAGMSFVPAGRVHWKSTTVDPETGEPRSFDETVYVEPFWIDRAPTTNGEWREFMAATGAQAPRFWEILEPSVTSDAAWNDRPVTAIMLSEARAYAEWRGKRLPRVEEWRRALELGAEEWLLPLADELEGAFVLARPAHLPSTTAAYVEQVQPVSTAISFGPLELKHPIGNTAEWLDSPGRRRTESGWEWAFDCGLMNSDCWHTPVERFDELPAVPLAETTLTSKSPDIGFRCAKSARPPD